MRTNAFTRPSMHTNTCLHSHTQAVQHTICTAYNTSIIFLFINGFFIFTLKKKKLMYSQHIVCMFYAVDFLQYSHGKVNDLLTLYILVHI